jgi:VanZ family protein
MFEKSRLLRVIPMLFVMGIIFFVSHQPGDRIDLPDIPDIDKLLHSLVYGVLAAATLYAQPSAFRRKMSLSAGLFTVVFCMLYGLSDEFHQSFIPGRNASVWDLLADTLGALLMVVVWFRSVEARLKS